MTGWRCAAIVGNAEAIAQYWRLKTNIDSGLFEAVQLAGAAALAPDADAEVASMNELYRRRRDLVCDALAKIGVDVRPPKGTIYIWAPVPEGFASAAAYCEHVLEEAAVVISPGGAYGPNGEGFFRISLTDARRAPSGGGRAPREAGGLTPVRYCGIDVSARPGNQRLVTLHERRGEEGIELVATFYEPGTVEAVARTLAGFGREAVVAVDAPSTHRLDLLAAGSPARAQLALPAGRYERSRVCDALLFRRGLPLYPVPARGQPTAAWERWMVVGFELYGALDGLGLYRPDAGTRLHGAGGGGRPAGRAAVRDLPGRDLLLPARPPPVAQAHAVGPAAAHRRRSSPRRVIDEDGGLWHRTLDELDACAAAYAAYALAVGRGCWVGDPRGGG